MKTSFEFTMTCRRYKGEDICEHKIKVDPDGTVRVWDDVGNYFTQFHDLTKRAMKKAREYAEKWGD